MATEDGCPRCASLKSVVPSLKLLFASCCGTVLCRNCVAEWFKKARAATCEECGQKIQATDFKSIPFGKQVLDKGRQSRSRFDAILNATEEDFEDQKTWYDHLEFLEDIVYMSVHGTAEEVKEADKRLKEYKKKNLHIFKRNITEKVSQADDVPQSTISVEAESRFSARVHLAPSVHSLPIPEVVSAPTKTSPLDPSKLTPSSKLVYMRREKVRSKLSKIAGGFTNKYDKLRIEEETFRGLHLFD